MEVIVAAICFWVGPIVDCRIVRSRVRLDPEDCAAITSDAARRRLLAHQHSAQGILVHCIALACAPAGRAT